MNTKETLREEWENKFPLNTFHGETKNQIVSLIDTLLSEQETRHEDIIRKSYDVICQLRQDNIDLIQNNKSELKDLIKTVEGMKKEMYSDGSGNMQDPAVANEDGYNSALDDIIRVMKERL